MMKATEGLNGRRLDQAERKAGERVLVAHRFQGEDRRKGTNLGVRRATWGQCAWVPDLSSAGVSGAQPAWMVKRATARLERRRLRQTTLKLLGWLEQTRPHRDELRLARRQAQRLTLDESSTSPE